MRNIKCQLQNEIGSKLTGPGTRPEPALAPPLDIEQEHNIAKD